MSCDSHTAPGSLAPAPQWARRRPGPHGPWEVAGGEGDGPASRCPSVEGGENGKLMGRHTSKNPDLRCSDHFLCVLFSWNSDPFGVGFRVVGNHAWLSLQKNIKKQYHLCMYVYTYNNMSICIYNMNMYIYNYIYIYILYGLMMNYWGSWSFPIGFPLDFPLGLQ